MLMYFKGKQVCQCTLKANNMPMHFKGKKYANAPKGKQVCQCTQRQTSMSELFNSKQVCQCTIKANKYVNALQRQTSMSMWLEQ